MTAREVNGEDDTPPHGFMPTLKVVAAKATQHDSDISALRGGLQTVVDEVGELRGDVAEVKGVVLRLEGSLGDMRTDLRRATMPPPAMRAELPSGIDLEAFASKVAKAAIEGERRPDSTPEREVGAVVDEVLERRNAAAIVKADVARSKRNEKIMLVILSVILAALLGHFIK